MNNKIDISVAIITKNEEKRLHECLKSVQFANDIIVVDSGSTDNTVEIARSFGCRVYVEEWKGYGPQKNSAIQKSKNEWVLVLDADENIPVETQKKIITVLKNPKADAYSFSRKTFFHGKWIRHCGWWPDKIVRLLRKSKGSFQRQIHESWATEGSVAHIDAFINHNSFENYSNMLKKLDEYSTATAYELHQANRKVLPTTPILRGLWTFFRIYIIKLGFLAGLDGLVIALTNAGGTFFKYAKLYELQKDNKYIEEK
ncbi:MAG: glycosyltransferase family 2 protein [Dissulfurispiraceae bacterium]|jgi:glycosyltransferase involved in cell wall biosynthesis|nr:glycosyltransferase family 2 protein [Dissulfurispiraceae bacterium]